MASVPVHDSFERPADYDSSDELERFYRANQPSPDTTMLMMLGPGTKRTAAFDQPTRDEVTQETMLTLVTAWSALLNAMARWLLRSLS